jgi:ATP-binding cassette, subfamily B, bacterial PglK
MKYLREIVFLLGDEKKRLPKFVVLFLSVSMLELIGIGLIGPYIAIISDSDASENASENFNRLFNFDVTADEIIILMSLLLVFIFFLKAASSIVIRYVILKFSADQQVRIRSFLMKSYQSLPYTEYLRRNSSEYINSVSSLSGQYANGVIASLIGMASDGIIALSIFVFLAWTDLMAFLLLICLISVTIFTYDLFSRKYAFQLGKRMNFSGMSMIKGISEAFEGFKEINVLGVKESFYNKVKKNAEIQGGCITRTAILGEIPRYLLEVVMVLFIALFSIISLKIGREMQELLPTLAIFGFAAIRLLPAANTFSGTFTKLRAHRDAVSKLYHDIASLRCNQDKTIHLSDASNNNLVSFKNLSVQEGVFHYPYSKECSLCNLNIDIQSGQSIGIIGESGSGKTTLIDILLGLLTPQKGSIFLNGELSSLDSRDWRDIIAYIPQEIFLIDDTLRRNIALGVDDGDIDESKVLSALASACLTSLIQQLPEGLDTMLGERGVRLSGGQRQRVALARAFYHEREIIVMDEATSALDDKTEREITKEIQMLKGEKTLIIIAHRHTTLQSCDYIYKLEKGRIISSGVPEKMLNIGGNS